MKEFIDEFKHLEKLCSEMYNQQHGVTLYIDDMERTPSYLASSIPGFSEDLSRLKRVRHIRNAMVHDDSDYDSEYEPGDVDFIKDFYDRIMAGQDPLSLLRARTQKPKKAKAAPKVEQSAQPILVVEQQAPPVVDRDDIPEADDYSFDTPAVRAVIVVAVLALLFAIGSCIWAFIN